LHRGQRADLCVLGFFFEQAGSNSLRHRLRRARILVTPSRAFGRRPVVHRCHRVTRTNEVWMEREQLAISTNDGREDKIV
jgi:hypothetical protein